MLRRDGPQTFALTQACSHKAAHTTFTSLTVDVDSRGSGRPRCCPRFSMCIPPLTRPPLPHHAQMHTRHAADVDAYNAVADEVMRELDVPSLDLYTATLKLGPDLFCDHVHYHDHVRKAQAEYIAEWVADHFSSASLP